MAASVELLDRGTVDYAEALALQRELFQTIVDRKTDTSLRGAQRRSNPEQYRIAAPCGLAMTEMAKSGENAGWLILCEHPHVYTLGKSGRAENLLVSEEFLRDKGAALYRIERGGDITYHGPGQIVGYPILDLERVGLGLREYIEAVEQSVIETVAAYGIEAGRVDGKTGVWVSGCATTPSALRAATPPSQGGESPTRELSSFRNRRQAESHRACSNGRGAKEENKVKEEYPRQRRGGGGRFFVEPRKICAIGVKASRGVVMHGFALNVATDLKWFEYINPCGFTDGGVTSIEKEVGEKVDMGEVKRVLCGRLEQNLKIRL